MLRLILAINILTVFVATAASQSTTRPKYLEHALIEHTASGVTVVANDPVPLFQAITAIRQEYGWRINWEDAPCYSPFEVVDDTDPNWRNDHPGEKGVTRAAGGRFTSAFQEPKDATPEAKRDILQKVINDYNESGNPGKYALRMDSKGLLSVVGVGVQDESGDQQDVAPLLDTPVSIERQQRSLEDAVKLLLNAISVATGKKITIMSVPNNEFRDTQVTVGGRLVAARDLLKEALDGTRRPLQYDLGFDPDVPVYILNVSVASRAEVDDMGRRRLVPIDRNR